MRKRLSIVVPVYQAEAFVEQAIVSVLGQEWPECELVLIDDGSTDASGEICRRYAGENAQYVRTQNLGAGHARNVGIDAANGDWIAFLDSDDLILPGFLAPGLGAFLQAHEDADILYGGALGVDMALEGEARRSLPEPVEQIQNHMPALSFCAALYRAQFLRERGVRFYTYREQDVESAFRFLAFSRARKIVAARELLFHVCRENPHSNTHNLNLDNLNEIKGKIYLDLYRNCEGKADTRAFLYGVFLRQVSQFVRRNVREGFTPASRKQALELLGLMRETAPEARSLPLTARQMRSLERMRRLFAWPMSVRWLCAVRRRKPRPQAAPQRQCVPGTPAILARLEALAAQYPPPWQSHRSAASCSGSGE